RVFEGVVDELAQVKLNQFRVHKNQRQLLSDQDPDFPAVRQGFHLLERRPNQRTSRMKSSVHLEPAALDSSHLNRLGHKPRQAVRTLIANRDTSLLPAHVRRSARYE